MAAKLVAIPYPRMTTAAVAENVDDDADDEEDDDRIRRQGIFYSFEVFA